MERIYTEDDIRIKLTKYRDDAASELLALEHIERQYTKEGKPFKVLSKNFKNASIISVYDNKTLRASYSDPITHNYHKYDLDIEISSHDLPKDDPRYNSVCGCLYCRYDLSLDEICEKIEEHKDILRNRIDKYNKQLENLSYYFNAANDIVKLINDFYNSSSELHDTIGLNTLGYSLKDFIKSNI